MVGIVSIDLPDKFMQTNKLLRIVHNGYWVAGNIGGFDPEGELYNIIRPVNGSITNRIALRVLLLGQFNTLFGDWFTTAPKAYQVIYMAVPGLQIPYQVARDCKSGSAGYLGEQTKAS